jgi:hypothetical protein
LYSPLGGAAAAVAWGVRNPAATLGPVTVVPFSTINVNLQGVWNTTTNTVTIPVAGTYFIDLTAALRGSGSSAAAMETTVFNRVSKFVLEVVF